MEGNDPLPFDIWMFRGGQLKCDDDSIIIEAVMST